MKERVAVYIDGSNFYFSVKRKFNYNVDISKFCEKLIGNNELIKINYYIAPIEQFNNPDGYAKQQSFLDNLRKIPNLNIVFGRLEKRKREGKTYLVEKATDVNLALDLVLDAQANEYDEAYLISNDGDFSGAVKAVIERFYKKLIYVAVGTSSMISHHLKKVSSLTFKVDESFVKDCKIQENS